MSIPELEISILITFSLVSFEVPILPAGSNSMSLIGHLSPLDSIPNTRFMGNNETLVSTGSEISNLLGT